MNKNKKNVISALVFSLLSIIGYLITYNNKVLFFLIFLGERLYSFGAKDELENSIDNLELEEGKKGKNTIGIIVLLTICTILVSIYSIFKYPELLFIMIVGELLDYSIYKLYKKYKHNKIVK